MKVMRKLALIILVAISLIKPSFISADEDTEPLTVKVPVSVKGYEAVVSMIPWEKKLKNPCTLVTDEGDKNIGNCYKPGPALSNPTITVPAGQTGNFEIEFLDPGNYVYEIKQVKNKSNVEYDVDIEGTDKIYRFYITVVYKDDTNEEMAAYFEAETCDDYSCILEPVSETDVRVPEDYDFKPKPTEVCFENKVKPTPPPIPKTGVTVRDVIITGGLCSEFFILLLLLFKRKKKKET